ncbi:MAG TPA: efflux RND transporter permease subunit [Ectothiorhodospiraceae bacterium]|nr:efflux RND transporter permease subunit [Ectothiorhodospiraceae bacterium]
MIAWFARNHVSANLLMISILIAGLLSLSQRIPLEVFPTIERQQITVTVTLPGATPEDVEQGISILVEEAVQDLEGIVEITSRSAEGLASIGLELDSAYDARDLLADIKGRVDAINNFPVDAERPVVSLPIFHRREVITAVVAGDYTEKEIRYQAEQVKDDLQRIPGITQVELDSVRPFEIAIEISQQRLRQYGLTLGEVAQKIANSSKDISAGNIKAEGGEILVRSKGQAYHRDQFENITILTQPDGSLVKLRELAQVNDGFEEAPLRSRFNGKMAAFVDVYRVGNQSAIAVADSVKQYIAEHQQDMPEGVELSYWRDRSNIVKKRLQTLTNNAIQGGILVLLLLTLFLRPSVAFWVFIGVPISFMGAFIVMPFFGVTLNIFSLFAFLLVLGIVVDDAIVTGENIYTHLRHADNGLHAVVQGTREVAVPVTFGVLTTVVAFLPLAFIEGNRGQLFMQIPIVVIPIFLFSLIESKLVLPAHLKHIRLRSEKSSNRLERFQQRFADGFEHAIIKYYRPLLERVLNYRLLTLVSFFAILLIMISLIMNGWSRFTFFPRVQSEVARASLTMPTGTPFEVTDRYIQKITGAAFTLKRKYHEQEGIDLILDIQSSTGIGGSRSSGSHTGRVMFEIVAPEDRDSEITSLDLIKQWRKMIGSVPGAESLTYRAEIGRVSDPIDIQFSGNDFTILSEVGEKLKEQLALYPAVFDIEDSLSSGKEELQIELKPEAYALGLSRAELLEQIRSGLFGFQIQRIQRGRDDIRVMVRFPKSERESIASLLEQPITTQTGVQVPLGQLVTLKPGISPTSIIRIDRYRTLKVSADINKETANMTLIQSELKEYIDNLLVNYPGVHYSMEGEAKEQSESFRSMGIGLLVVIFVIYALLAIPFKSYLQPIVVMSIIPFGAIGAIGGHWIMGMDLSLLSIMGMLALVGVVVNDSLVLVDFINTHKNERGHSLKEAVLNAGVARFRPVMLTSLTTFIGLMPLLFEQSTQAQFLIPMAVSLGFGILFATFITLLLVPVNYMLLEEAKQAWYRFIGEPYMS